MNHMKPIYVNGALHARAKGYATKHGLKLYALAERALTEAIKDGKAKPKK